MRPCRAGRRAKGWGGLPTVYDVALVAPWLTVAAFLARRAVITGDALSLWAWFLVFGIGVGWLAFWPLPARPRWRPASRTQVVPFGEPRDR